MPAAIDITGQRFSRLTAVALLSQRKKKNRMWLCICVCGNTIEVAQIRLRIGNTTSCGCRQKELQNTISERGFRTHGMRNSSEYRAWTAMKQRCYNENVKAFKNYGARGIRVCDRWLDSFEAFLEDMGKKPSPKLELDRIDNNGNYEPANCRWTTRSENLKNTRPRIRSVLGQFTSVTVTESACG